MIMSSSIGYLTSRSTFLQVSPEIPITKSRNPDKFDPPEVFEGELTVFIPSSTVSQPVHHTTVHSLGLVDSDSDHRLPCDFNVANKRELVNDLIVKAKQIEVLIQSLPVPEPEETQASLGCSFLPSASPHSSIFFRLTPLSFMARISCRHTVSKFSNLR
ncbi:hypothetical protein JVU11DRAFT_3458 [Chiua virens]|nr:hypothetical protein JVU11DRAFT_3458 [Chiua virens]